MAFSMALAVLFAQKGGLSGRAGGLGTLGVALAQQLPGRRPGPGILVALAQFAHVGAEAVTVLGNGDDVAMLDVAMLP